MKRAILSSVFIATILLLPLLLKTLGLSCPFVDGLVDSLTVIFILLTVLNLIGLVCLQTVKKFSNFIDTKDLLAENEIQKKIENHIAYKIYRHSTLILLFALLMYNRMNLTTIFACVWWLSNHFFKVCFDGFVEELD